MKVGGWIKIDNDEYTILLKQKRKTKRNNKKKIIYTSKLVNISKLLNFTKVKADKKTKRKLNIHSKKKSIHFFIEKRTYNMRF